MVIWSCDSHWLERSKERMAPDISRRPRAGTIAVTTKMSIDGSVVPEWIWPHPETLHSRGWPRAIAVRHAAIDIGSRQSSPRAGAGLDWQRGEPYLECLAPQASSYRSRF